MTDFFKKLGEMANNKFKFLRLKEALVDDKNFSVVLYFVIPNNLSEIDWNPNVVAELEHYVKDILPSDFNTEFKYTKSVLDEDVFIKVINDYIKENQSALIGEYDASKIKVDIESEDLVKILIPAFDIAIKYCKDTGFLDKLVAFLNRSFCAEIKVDFKSMGKQDATIIKKEVDPVYIDKGLIYVKNRVKFFGGECLLNPRYIEKYTKPTTEAVVCGRLGNFERKISKKNGRIFYTFTLDDSTGEMRCVAFSRSTKKGAFDWLMNTDDFMATFGKSTKEIPESASDVNPCLVVEGELVEDTFKKGLTLLVRKASYCKIDFNEISENRAKQIVMQKKKHKSYPVPYSVSSVDNLFDMVDEPCSFILNNDIVVFDLETTGLDTTKAKIIELGAVKVHNGEIVSYYNSLVDPKMPIPADASKVNNIFDNDVADAPYIEDCLQDFMDYCENCVLVAHNGDFYDFKILRRECYDLGIPMENRLMDSLTMSRKAYPEFPNHKLDTLCKRLGVTLTNAHRAYFDAEATAKVFIKLCNKMKLK